VLLQSAIEEGLFEGELLDRIEALPLDRKGWPVRFSVTGKIGTDFVERAARTWVSAEAGPGEEAREVGRAVRFIQIL